MEISKQFLKQNKPEHLLFVLLLAVFIILDVPVPDAVGKLVDTTLGNLIVVIIALAVALHHNMVVGLVGVIAAYELIRRSNKSGIPVSVRRFVPSEKNKMQEFERLNQNIDLNKESLEEKIISENAPIPTQNFSAPSYSAVLDKTHNAVELEN